MGGRRTAATAAILLGFAAGALAGGGGCPQCPCPSWSDETCGCAVIQLPKTSGYKSFSGTDLGGDSTTRFWGVIKRKAGDCGSGLSAYGNSNNVASKDVGSGCQAWVSYTHKAPGSPAGSPVTPPKASPQGSPKASPKGSPKSGGSPKAAPKAGGVPSGPSGPSGTWYKAGRKVPPRHPGMNPECPMTFTYNGGSPVGDFRDLKNSHLMGRICRGTFDSSGKIVSNPVWCCNAERKSWDQHYILRASKEWQGNNKQYGVIEDGDMQFQKDMGWKAQVMFFVNPVEKLGGGAQSAWRDAWKPAGDSNPLYKYLKDLVPHVCKKMPYLQLQILNEVEYNSNWQMCTTTWYNEMPRNLDHFGGQDARYYARHIQVANQFAKAFKTGDCKNLLESTSGEGWMSFTNAMRRYPVKQSGGNGGPGKGLGKSEWNLLDVHFYWQLSQKDMNQERILANSEAASSNFLNHTGRFVNRGLGGEDIRMTVTETGISGQYAAGYKGSEEYKANYIVKFAAMSSLMGLGNAGWFYIHNMNGGSLFSTMGLFHSVQGNSDPNKVKMYKAGEYLRDLISAPIFFLKSVYSASKTYALQSTKGLPLGWEGFVYDSKIGNKVIVVFWANAIFAGGDDKSWTIPATINGFSGCKRYTMGKGSDSSPPPAESGSFEATVTPRVMVCDSYNPKPANANANTGDPLIHGCGDGTWLCTGTARNLNGQKFADNAPGRCTHDKEFGARRCDCQEQGRSKDQFCTYLRWVSEKGDLGDPEYKEIHMGRTGALLEEHKNAWERSRNMMGMMGAAVAFVALVVVVAVRRHRRQVASEAEYSEMSETA